jgi:hypothetical protein
VEVAKILQPPMSTGLQAFGAIRWQLRRTWSRIAVTLLSTLEHVVALKACDAASSSRRWGNQQ